MQTNWNVYDDQDLSPVSPNQQPMIFFYFWGVITFRAPH